VAGGEIRLGRGQQHGDLVAVAHERVRPVWRLAPQVSAVVEHVVVQLRLPSESLGEGW
jgi:hypothetical protein